MEIKKYCPSNGTEGMMFMSQFCDQCEHEKFTHTQDHDDKQCPILSATMVNDPSDPEYPEAWTYDEAGNPTCTEFKQHTWRDPFTDELIEPEDVEETNDPDQLDLFNDQ